MLKAAVVGATGYSGEQLIKMLVFHPNVELVYACGKEDRKDRLQDIFPYLRGRVDLPCNAFNPNDALCADVIFLALPHTVSMRYAKFFLDKNKQVIDISADFRLKDAVDFNNYYNANHECPDLLKKAVYGLPEWKREAIKKTDLIANPGCYPTSVLLGLLPILNKNRNFASTVVIDSKSGVTGAGKKVNAALLFPEVNESFKAYKIQGHQHEAEIHMGFAEHGVSSKFVFAPHLLPVNRGILSTIYAPLDEKLSKDEVIKLYNEKYRDEPFVQVYPEGALPQLSNVVGTNQCHIGLAYRPYENMMIIVSVIDNLLKGASGQAVQNMNIRNGFDETAGLN